MVFPQPATLMDTETGPGPEAASSKPQTHIVKASHGFAFEVKKGDRFRIVDLYGEQVVDFAAWVQNTNLVEKLSMAYTRFEETASTIGKASWN